MESENNLIGYEDQACCWAVSMEITIAVFPHFILRESEREGLEGQMMAVKGEND